MKPQIMIKKHLYLVIVTLVCFTSVFSQNDIQRVRIDLSTPTGYVRQLLLGFTPDNAASDGVDFGYDAASFDSFPNDFGWVIEDQSYIIQGVGEFSVDKFYPIGAFLSDSGEVSFHLNSLENFNQDISVFIYDTLNNTYSKLNDGNYFQDLNSGDYLNRFFITFRNDFPLSMWQDVLSVEEQSANSVRLAYNKNLNSISVKLKDSDILKDLKIYNSLGKKISAINLNTSNKQLNINTNTFSKGVYIINITTNLLKTTRKVVVH